MPFSAVIGKSKFKPIRFSQKDKKQDVVAAASINTSDELNNKSFASLDLVNVEGNIGDIQDVRPCYQQNTAINRGFSDKPKVVKIQSPNRLQPNCDAKLVDFGRTEADCKYPEPHVVEHCREINVASDKPGFHDVSNNSSIDEKNVLHSNLPNEELLELDLKNEDINCNKVESKTSSQCDVCPPIQKIMDFADKLVESITDFSSKLADSPSIAAVYDGSESARPLFSGEADSERAYTDDDIDDFSIDGDENSLDIEEKRLNENTNCNVQSLLPVDNESFAQFKLGGGVAICMLTGSGICSSNSCSLHFIHGDSGVEGNIWL